jgi:hypothetical protein
MIYILCFVSLLITKCNCACYMDCRNTGADDPTTRTGRDKRRPGKHNNGIPDADLRDSGPAPGAAAVHSFPADVPWFRDCLLLHLRLTSPASRCWCYLFTHQTDASSFMLPAFHLFTPQTDASSFMLSAFHLFTPQTDMLSVCRLYTPQTDASSFMLSICHLLRRLWLHTLCHLLRFFLMEPVPLYSYLFLVY